jgi:hypothetical protein
MSFSFFPRRMRAKARLVRRPKYYNGKRQSLQVSQMPPLLQRRRRRSFNVFYVRGNDLFFLISRLYYFTQI